MMDFAPLWVSLKTAIAATTLAVVSGTATAYFVFTRPQQNRWVGILDGLFTLPLILPPTVVGFLLLLLLGRNSPVGQLLEAVGISLLLSWPATVLASTVVAFPLMYKTVLGAFHQVDGTILDCARTLGTSERRIMLQLLLPLAGPGVLTGTILAFARALGEFGATLMIAGNIPGRTETMPMAIFFAGEAGRLDEALMWTLILVGIALGAIAIINTASHVEILDFRCIRQAQHRFGILARLVSFLKKARDIFLLLGAARGGSFHKPNTAAPQLTVDIIKAFPDLTISASFTTGTAPLAILGASGSGKSTLLRCIAGLVTPSAGRIVLNDRVLFDAATGINIPSARRRVGVVFQNYALFPHMTVAQNIGFGLHTCPRQICAPSEQHARISYYLNLLQLQSLADAYPHQLSGGQQQRVALARALAPQPDVLLLDEPLSALDPHLRDRLQHHLGQIFATHPGPVLFVTHNMSEAYRLCDRWLVLDQGRIHADGPKEGVCDRPPTVAVAQLTGCQNISRIEVIDSRTVRALDWNAIALQVPSPIPANTTHIGIRAHHIQFLLNPDEDLSRNQMIGMDETPSRMALRHRAKANYFPCKILTVNDTQTNTLIDLCLNPPNSDNSEARPNYDGTVHLQVEVSKDAWATIYQYQQKLQGFQEAIAMECWVWLALDELILMTDNNPSGNVSFHESMQD